MPSNPSEVPKATRLTVALVVFALVVVPTAIYIAGYLWLGERSDYLHSGGGEPTGTMTIERMYPQRWIAIAYQPAGRLEQWLRGRNVEVNVTCKADKPRHEAERPWPIQ